MPIETTAASVPPARNASASSKRIIRHASPIAWHAVAQAERWQKFGPRNPNSMETRPLAMLLIIIGIMNGETRDGPLFMRIVCWSSKVLKPADAAAEDHAKAGKIGDFIRSTAASANAIFAAAMPSWVETIRAGGTSLGLLK